MGAGLRSLLMVRCTSPVAPHALHTSTRHTRAGQGMERRRVCVMDARRGRTRCEEDIMQAWAAVRGVEDVGVGYDP